MKTTFSATFALVLLCGVVSTSCTRRANPVPDMPYRMPRAQAATQPVAPTPTPAPVAQTTTVDTWMTSYTPAPTAPLPPASTQVPLPAPAPAPAPGASGTHITQPPLPTPAPAPVVQQPAPAPAPAPAPSTASGPKLISNDGPIPVATRVPGDPLRVYNPLDPTKKIKVIDKNGNPQPSGKMLKVPGTNFFFYVP